MQIFWRQNIDCGKGPSVLPTVSNLFCIFGSSVWWKIRITSSNNQKHRKNLFLANLFRTPGTRSFQDLNKLFAKKRHRSAMPFHVVYHLLSGREKRPPIVWRHAGAELDIFSFKGNINFWLKKSCRKYTYFSGRIKILKVCPFCQK